MGALLNDGEKQNSGVRIQNSEGVEMTAVFWLLAPDFWLLMLT
jgi:hypothetical protein